MSGSSNVPFSSTALESIDGGEDSVASDGGVETHQGAPRVAASLPDILSPSLAASRVDAHPGGPGAASQSCLISHDGRIGDNPAPSQHRLGDEDGVIEADSETQARPVAKPGTPVLTDVIGDVLSLGVVEPDSEDAHRSPVLTNALDSPQDDSDESALPEHEGEWLHQAQDERRDSVHKGPVSGERARASTSTVPPGGHDDDAELVYDAIGDISDNSSSGHWVTLSEVPDDAEDDSPDPAPLEPQDQNEGLQMAATEASWTSEDFSDVDR
jgi:hypothetical protein